MADVYPEVGAERTQQEDDSCAPSHFFAPETWATANSIGVELVRECLRREVKPLPHLRIGVKYLVDDELALTWWRRHYGVGMEEGR